MSGQPGNVPNAMSMFGSEAVVVGVEDVPMLNAMVDIF